MNKFLVAIILGLMSYGVQAQIVINEFVAANDSTTGISDPNGQYEDWVELHNTSGSAVDISGYHLSDDLENPTLWSFPNNTMIEANGYLVVWADNDTMDNGLHAFFKLSKSGEDLILSTADITVLDAFAYTEQDDAKSSARIPNGSGNFSIQDGTPNANNESEIGAKVATNSIVVNEIMASNTLSSGISDSGGEYDDWVEFYNKNNEEVDLSGYYFSDDPNHKRKWAFPYGTTIAANSYLIVWCDNDQEQADLHTNFNISNSGETVLLSYDDGTVIDEVTFGPQISNVSYARIPNGGTIFIQTQPTFNASNEVPATTELQFKDIVINEFVAANDSTSGIMDAGGEFGDWIEIYNNTDQVVSLENCFLSDSIGFPKQWAFPDTILGSQSYLIVWADNDPNQLGLHTNFNLNRLGEQLILSYIDNTVLDSLSFGEQIVNMASARRPNGTGDFEIQVTTFGLHNDPDFSGELSLHSLPVANIKLYPNPVNAELIINLDGDVTHLNTIQISIYNELNQLLRSDKKTIVNSSFSLDVDALAKGVYFVEIVGDDYRGLGRFVK